MALAIYTHESTDHQSKKQAPTLSIPVPFHSGGIAHTNDLLATTYSTSEAEAFADRMVACGVPNSSILREPIAKNTGAATSLPHLQSSPAFSMTAEALALLSFSAPLPGDNFNLTRVCRNCCFCENKRKHQRFAPGALLIERDVPLPTRALVVTKPYMCALFSSPEG
jgi:hypothetical protein